MDQARAFEPLIDTCFGCRQVDSVDAGGRCAPCRIATAAFEDAYCDNCGRFLAGRACVVCAKADDAIESAKETWS